jgi:hypothetical protein
MDFSSFAVLYRNYRLFQHYAEAEEDTLTEAEFNKLLEGVLIFYTCFTLNATLTII